MMVSKEEMVDVLKTAAVSGLFPDFSFCPGLYLAIGVSSWANFLMFSFYRSAVERRCCRPVG